MDSMIINHEWSTRPDDQRFTSLSDLHAFNLRKKAASIERGVALDHMRLSTDNGNILLSDGDNKPSSLSHWSFGQLCQRSRAPAGYLRTLPACLAVIPLQWSMEQEREDANLLVRDFDPGESLSTTRVEAVTSSSYGRIFDAAVSDAVIRHVDQNVWKVPSASYASRNPKKATTLYASDRDCFIALVDDTHPIQVPGNDGRDTLFRGFIVRNSEVGSAAFDFIAFLYRTICDNRIIWGGQEVLNIKIRHTSGGPMRFMREASPMLTKYLEASSAGTVAQIQEAQTREVGKSEKDVASWLKARGFTDTVAKGAIDASASEPGLNPRSLWGVVQGLTAYAQNEQYGDERFDLERKAGKLLSGL